MKRKHVNVLILSVLCIALLPLIPIIGHYENRIVPNVAYTPHEPIAINGDIELAAFCTTGSGTEADPYIIEGHSFTGSSNAIKIENTTAYLCIRNNEFINQTWAALYIEGVQNINISGNFISNFDRGIVIMSSQNIEISRNSIINSDYGIVLSVSSNITLQSNTIQNILHAGILFEGSHSSQISGNVIEDSGEGIWLEDYDYNNYNSVFTNNTFNRCGFSLGRYAYNLTIDTSNKVNGKSLRYFEGKTGISLTNEPDIGQLVLNNVNNSEFRGLNISSTSIGLKVVNSNYNTFSNFVLTNNTQIGLDLDNSSFNVIKMNKIEDNNIGFSLFRSRNNTIAGNLVKNNPGKIDYFVGNLIYYNSFIGNYFEVGSDGDTNIWVKGQRGNYWSNYMDKYPNATNNGIVWDTPYDVYKDNYVWEQDRYPLVYIPFSEFGTPNLSMTSNDSSNGTVTLQWTSILEARYYLIYRSNSEISSVQGLTPIANTTATTYTENVPEGTYYYVVVAVNEFMSSDISNNIKFEVPPGQTIDGFPLAMIGIICVITLMIKRRSIET